MNSENVSGSVRGMICLFPDFVIPLSKMLYKMETASIQTAFRFPPELVARIKREAKRNKKSVNAYVTEILDRETRLEWPKLPKDYKVSQSILDLRMPGHFIPPTEAQLTSDPKLRYLWNKHYLQNGQKD